MHTKKEYYDSCKGLEQNKRADSETLRKYRCRIKDRHRLYPRNLAFAGPGDAFAEALLPKPWRVLNIDFLVFCITFSPCCIDRWITPRLTKSKTRSTTCRKAGARRPLRTRSVINTAPIWCSSSPSIHTLAASGKEPEVSKPP